jgi:Rhomboid-like protein
VTRFTAGLLSRRLVVAWLYLGGYSLFAVVYTFLPAGRQAEIVAWSSTNLVNLRHDPAGSLAASAFIPGDPAITWAVLGALGLFTVNRLLGNIRTAALLATAHVAGTLVSEGIVGYQVSHAILPQSARTAVDVGPSYVIVCALVAATLYGTWERVPAGAGFAVLAFHIFGGISHLEVTATGHLVAVTTGALLGGLLLRGARRAGTPAGVAAEAPAAAPPAAAPPAAAPPAAHPPAAHPPARPGAIS